MKEKCLLDLQYGGHCRPQEQFEWSGGDGHLNEERYREKQKKVEVAALDNSSIV